jgi:hypothetical protein
MKGFTGYATELLVSRVKSNQRQMRNAFFFPLSRYCTFQNSWTWEIPKGEIHVELVDLASLWTCFAPAEGAEIFGHPKLSIFLLKFIFSLPKSPKSISTGMDLYL